MGEGPLVGLPYDRIIQSVQQQLDIKDAVHIIQHITHKINTDLVTFQINHEKLLTLQTLFNDCAYCYLHSSQSEEITIREMFHHPNPKSEWHKIIQQIYSILPTLIVCYHKIHPHSSFIQFATDLSNVSEEISSFYCRLAFAKNNHWLTLISHKNMPVNIMKNTDQKLKPWIISRQTLYESISAINPGFNHPQKMKILEDIIQYKKWSL
jgi:biotin synthase-like enzyme